MQNTTVTCCKRTRIVLYSRRERERRLSHEERRTLHEEGNVKTAHCHIPGTPVSPLPLCGRRAHLPTNTLTEHLADMSDPHNVRALVPAMRIGTGTPSVEAGDKETDFYFDSEESTLYVLCDVGEGVLRWEFVTRVALTQLTNKINELDTAKANKATTLSGYGITDAATKEEVEANADKTELEAEVSRAQGAETQLTNKIIELESTKADKTELDSAVAEIKDRLSYALVVKGIENGAVIPDDRADNYVDARTLGSSDSLDIDFPPLVDGRSRDFVLAVECGENPPTISYAAFATIMAEDASTLAPEPGMNIYAFTEFKTNMFLASRKKVDTVVVNTPESSDQLLLAMQKRGIDTTNITDFGVVAATLGLGDDATPQDAIDVVMN